MCSGRITPAKEQFAISADIQKKAVEALCTMAENFQYDRLKRLVAELELCEMADDIRKNIDSLKAAVDTENAKEIFAMVDKLKTT